jgi:hypothetical protein
MRSKKEIQLNSDLIELLAALEKYDVRYMIIGGHAVGFHVEPRFTKDFDIWISTTKRNALAIYRALAEFGAPLKDYTPEDFEEDGHFYQFGEYPNRVDVLMGPPGPKFASAWRNRIETEISGQKAIYVGRKTLVELKTAAGRPIDRRDLRAIHESSPFARNRKRTAKTRKAHSAHKQRRRSAPGKGDS